MQSESENKMEESAFDVAVCKLAKLFNRPTNFTSPWGSVEGRQ